MYNYSSQHSRYSLCLYMSNDVWINNQTGTCDWNSPGCQIKFSNSMMKCTQEMKSLFKGKYIKNVLDPKQLNFKMNDDKSAS